MVTLILSTVGIAGCATVWEKPGATQADFNKDSYECERDARQSGYYGTGLAGAINMQNFADRCMIARGWSEKKDK